MRVCDQFTDERFARFVPLANHELEVHSSVDLTDTPRAVDLGVERPIAIVGDDSRVRRAENPLDWIHYGVHLAQGERVLGLQSYPGSSEIDSDKQLRVPRYIEGDNTDILEADEDVLAQSLAGLTHAIVELDTNAVPFRAFRQLDNEDTAFSGGGYTAMLPIDEPIPNVLEGLEDREAFVVRGFVNKAGEQVTWRSHATGANWLVDLCVMNAYVHNRVELDLLRYSVGDAVLNGLVSVDSTTRAYLSHFDARYRTGNIRSHGGVTFLPSSEPKALGHERRFPSLTRQEANRLMKLHDVSYRAMTTPNRDNLK